MERTLSRTCCCQVPASPAAAFEQHRTPQTWPGLAHYILQRGELPDIESSLYQVARFVTGIAGVRHHRAIPGDVSAQIRAQLNHLRREGADGGDKGVRSRVDLKYHGTGRGA